MIKAWEQWDLKKKPRKKKTARFGLAFWNGAWTRGTGKTKSIGSIAVILKDGGRREEGDTSAKLKAAEKKG